MLKSTLADSPFYFIKDLGILDSSEKKNRHPFGDALAIFFPTNESNLGATLLINIKNKDEITDIADTTEINLVVFFLLFICVGFIIIVPPFQYFVY